MNRAIDDMNDPNLDTFRVNAVGLDNPVAKAVIAIQDQYPGKMPVRYRDKYYGGPVDEIYIYPPPVPVAAT